jgi:hypothetical protein
MLTGLVIKEMGQTGHSACPFLNKRTLFYRRGCPLALDIDLIPSKEIFLKQVWIEVRLGRKQGDANRGLEDAYRWSKEVVGDCVAGYFAPSPKADDNASLDLIIDWS